MIEGKIIKFGYGDVGVGASDLGYMVFGNIIPPQEIGTNLNNKIKNKEVEVTSETVIYENNYFDFLELFKNINENNRVVEYKGYTFDFTNYKQGSVNVCLKYARNTVNSLILAC